MKKLLLIVGAVVVFGSCTTITETARTEGVPYSMYNATIADLEVAPERVVYTFTPNAAVRRGGPSNCKNAAIQEVLTKYGNADLMLDPEFVVESKRYLLRSKVYSVTVSGRPAKYKNFRSVNDSVWCNPAFRSNKEKEPRSIISVLKFWEK